MLSPFQHPPEFVRAQLAWIEAHLASPRLSPLERQRWERWRATTRTYLPADDAEEAS